jgi:hypothetical protein
VPLCARAAIADNTQALFDGGLKRLRECRSKLAERQTIAELTERERAAGAEDPQARELSTRILSAKRDELRELQAN